MGKAREWIRKKQCNRQSALFLFLDNLVFQSKDEFLACLLLLYVDVYRLLSRV